MCSASPARCDELMAKYGLTVDNIVEAAHDVLKRKK